MTRRAPLRVCLVAFLSSSVLWLSAAASAASIDQARRLHDRLAGVPPDAEVLSDMVGFIDAGQVDLAAELAMQNPAFYSVVLKNFFTPFSNVEQTVFAEFNDYVATAIGIVRDERDYREILSGDVVYVGDATNPAVADVPYSHFDNEHYRQLEANRVDLSNASLFFSTEQSTLPGSQLSSTDAAGVLTTRAAGMEFFSAGTNRRMWRFTGMNFLCRDMEELKDTSRASDRIRQDVNRSPGGDSELFHQQCSGCHSGMDPMAGAFAYFEWNEETGRVIHTPGFVQPKHLINANTFQGGYITTDNRWDNFWREGPNAVLGWRSAFDGGYGPQSLGQEVADSRAFSLCQVQKVFEGVCFRGPVDAIEAGQLADIADEFELSGYRMKTVFARTAALCMGE